MTTTPERPRIVSMVPAGTEIVAALGGIDRLAAVSHDCDWPPPVHDLPNITACDIDGMDLSSEEIDRWVHRTLAERGSLYTIDEARLRRIAPTAILTQQLCDVCAPTYGSVAQLANTLERPPTVIDLEPESLEDIFADIRTVADALGDPEAGVALVAALTQRVAHVRGRTADLAANDRPRVMVLEWLEPLFATGHWGPELVASAGGVELVGRSDAPSRSISWSDVTDAAPDVLVIAACGLGIDRTLRELPSLTERPGWHQLPAVRSGRVFFLDGSAYLSRPGPRIVDTLEIFGGILHPDRLPEFAPDRWPAHAVRPWAATDMSTPTSGSG